jgi:hypothetical protein
MAPRKVVKAKRAVPGMAMPTPPPAGGYYNPTTSVRNRMAASEAFARRDGKPKAGEFIPFYSDVTKRVNDINKWGSTRENSQGFAFSQAVKNTIGGRQYLPSTGRGGVRSNSGIKVRYGTVAGPKTAVNMTDLYKAKIMNEDRDAKLARDRKRKP